MGISLVMWRMSPEAAAQALQSGELASEPEPLEVFEKIDKGWDILTHILAAGVRDGETPLAALAIEGGYVLENELPDFGGTRLLLPSQVRPIYDAVAAIDDVEVERRYERLDFTGRYGSEGSRPASELRSVLYGIHELQGFYARAAADDSAVSIWYE